MKTILVTGGCGYIGSVLARQLRALGHKVRIFDALLFDGQAQRSSGGPDLICGDICADLKPEHFAGVDMCMHLAGVANDPTAELDPRLTAEVNYEGTRKVALMCKEQGVEVMTFASSASVYGFNTGVCDELTLLNPQSVYAQSKMEAEQALIELAEPGKFHPIIFRQGTVVGHSPRMRFDLVLNTMVRDANTKGRLKAVECHRPLIDVEDVARCHTLMTTTKPLAVPYELYNVAAFNAHIPSLAEKVNEVLGKKLPIDIDLSNPDIRNYRIDCLKARQTFGFNPSIGYRLSITAMQDMFDRGRYGDPYHDRYYNLAGMKRRLGR